MLRTGVILLALTLASCGDGDPIFPRWRGWVYPDAAYLPDDIPIGHFDSLELCRSSAKIALSYLEERSAGAGGSVKGDYECGYKCKQDGGPSGLFICEKTER